MRRDTLVYGIGVCPIGGTNLDIEIFQPKSWIDVGCDFVIGFNDILDVDVDEVVEGINVLLNQPFHFEKCGKQQPFILPRIKSEEYTTGTDSKLTYLYILDRVCQANTTPIPIKSLPFMLFCQPCHGRRGLDLSQCLEASRVDLLFLAPRADPYLDT